MNEKVNLLHIVDTEVYPLPGQADVFGYPVVYANAERTWGEWLATERTIAAETMPSLAARKNNIATKIFAFFGRNPYEQEDYLRQLASDSASRAEAYKAEEAEAVGEVRTKIAALNRDEQRVLETTLGPILPEIFNQARECEFLGQDDKVIGRGRIALALWLKEASLSTPEQVINFIQWHHYELRKQRTDEKAQAVVDNEKAAYKAALSNAVLDEGWLPHHGSVAVAHATLHKVPVHVEDVFETRIKNHGGHFSGRFVGIAQGTADSRLEENIRLFSWHEFTHAVLGRFPTSKWLNEAMTEHLAKALKYGEPEVLQPSLRTLDDGIYGKERELLHALLNVGNKRIAPRIAITAYLDNDEHAFGYERFLELLDEAWGFVPSGPKHFLDIVNSRVVEVQEQLIQQGHANSLAQGFATEYVRLKLLESPNKILAPLEYKSTG